MLMHCLIRTLAVSILASAAALASASDINPQFSPDGSMLVFERTADGSEASHLVLVQIAQIDRLIRLTLQADGVRVTADGAIVANCSDGTFVFDKDGRQVSLDAIPPAGQPLSLAEAWNGDFGASIEKGLICRLTRENGAVVRKPIRASNGSQASFSPDGTQVVFLSTCGSDSNNPTKNLFVMNVDGSGLRQLTKQGGHSPIWSCDGSAIVYLTPRGRLCRIDSDGKGWKTLASKIPVTDPLRSLPDDKSFAVPHADRGKIAWYAFTPPSQHLVRLSPSHTVPVGALAPSLSLDGRSLAYLKKEGDSYGLFVECKGDVEWRAVFPPDDAPPGPMEIVWSNDGKRLAVSLGGSIWLIADDGEKVRIGAEAKAAKG